MKRDYPFIVCVVAAWLLIVALCVLLTVKARAQIAPGALHRLIGNPSGSNPLIPQTISGLYYWWRSSDLAVGNKVTNWIDRIQGASLTNETAATQPTNSASGVYFDGTMFLTNNPEFGLTSENTTGGGCTIFFILKWGDSTLTRAPYLSSRSNGVATANRTYSLISKALADSSNSGSRWLKMEGTSTWVPLLGADSGAYSIPTNQVITLCTAKTWSTTTDSYTNGVLSKSGITTDGSERFAKIGADYGGWFWKGTIIEEMIYTNVLTSLQISNLNYYATNTYGL